MNYYFLAASLPMLSLDGLPRLTVAEFLELCKEHLSPRDMAALSRLISDEAGKDDDNPLIRNWKARETALRNAVAGERAARSGRDPEAYLEEEERFDCYVRNIVSDAMSRENPRETELALDRLRWAIVEEVQGYNAFSSEAILAYGLKLKMAERWAKMDKEKGKEKVEEICSRGRSPSNRPIKGV